MGRRDHQIPAHNRKRGCVAEIHAPRLYHRAETASKYEAQNDAGRVLLLLQPRIVVCDAFASGENGVIRSGIFFLRMRRPELNHLR
jgi:hypothetical protein